MITERPWLTTLRILVDRSRDGIDLPTAWRILEIMQEHGQSLVLDWGEDDDLWECSWISGGERYGGRHESLQVAVWFAARDVLAPERRPRQPKGDSDDAPE